MSAVSRIIVVTLLHPWLQISALTVVCSVVLHDVRMARPLGRWVALVRLAAVRREYAFIYSTLLKVHV